MTTKSTTAKHKSDAFAAIHSAAKGLHSVGAINKTTMREYDELCLDSITELNANEIKRIREQAHVSQPVFARYLNTSESTVQKWETGQKRPSGMALRLLHVVEKHGLGVLV
ncbi:MAG: DNA-binding transcriptional regulator [Gallionella sp.]|jgi:putative transcriptional regulator|nr:DNA-binding transcriptional regulator [Gallionella sp.]MCK9355369.1 DNA-binding transcriptional regulator [Gallionella sp.]